MAYPPPPRPEEDDFPYIPQKDTRSSDPEVDKVILEVRDSFSTFIKAIPSDSAFAIGPEFSDLHRRVFNSIKRLKE